jgi:hypothetical protein
MVFSQSISLAEMYEKRAGLFITELILIAVVAGVLFKSWWIFGIMLCGSFFALRIKYLSAVIAILLSSAWAAAGFGLGLLFKSHEAAAVLAILSFIVALRVHLTAANWARGGLD